MNALQQRLEAVGEAGMSLVEVIIYSSLSAVLLSVLGGLFYVGFQTQAAAGGRDAATGAAGVVSNSLQTGIRRASSISASGTLLKARVATGANSWQCVTWVLTTDKKLKYKAGSAAITDTDYSSSTWTVLAVGASGGLAGSAFVAVGTQLTYSLTFTSGGITVPVAGIVTASAFGTGSPESC